MLIVSILKDINKYSDKYLFREIALPAKIERKILKSGDSKAAALPPDWLRMFNLDVGDNIDIFYNSIVIVKPQGFKLDPDFLKKEFSLILELEKRAVSDNESKGAESQGIQGLGNIRESNRSRQ